MEHDNDLFLVKFSVPGFFLYVFATDFKNAADKADKFSNARRGAWQNAWVKSVTLICDSYNVVE